MSGVKRNILAAMKGKGSAADIQAHFSPAAMRAQKGRGPRAK